jgi:hypothetical protein
LTHKPPDRQQYEHGYNGISHVCRPISSILNRKPEQEWYQEKKESDVTQSETSFVHARGGSVAIGGHNMETIRHTRRMVRRGYY